MCNRIEGSLQGVIMRINNQLRVRRIRFIQSISCITFSAFTLLTIPQLVQAQAVELPENVTTSWWEAVQTDITQREYHFSSEDQITYRAPNRANDLVAFVQPGNFEMEPRLDSLDDWKASIRLEGFYADGIKLYSSEPSNQLKINADDNRVVFDYLHFQEEYINNKEGLRQNFILKHGPTDVNEIEVRLNIAGLIPNKVHNSEIHLCQRQQGKLETQIIYKDLNCWDANNQKIDAHFEVTKNEVRIQLKNTKSLAYPITIDPISSSSSTTLQEDQAASLLGWCVSSAGDVNGDGYSDVIVSAIDYDKGQSNEGVVFLYLGSATGISNSSAQTIQRNIANARLGHSIACAGDVNGDGYSDIIIAPQNYTNGQSNEGTAYVYHGNGTNLSFATQLEINQANAYFGRSVASAGDVNGDGYSDVIVGAYLYDNGQSNEGAAFVFHGSSSGVSTTAATQLEENSSDSDFGFSVASAGDVNADGYSDVIVGAYSHESGQTNEGLAFVYHGSAIGISTSATTTLQKNQTGAWFGYSVSSAGDVNGDGYSDVIVGARLYTNGQSNEGCAFVFHGSASGVSTTSSVTLEANQASSWYGVSVSCAGDVNGDGFSDVIVGAPYFDAGGTDRGMARVYHGSASGINSTYATQINKTQNSTELGLSVASAGDVNGDGYSDVIVGANRYNAGQSVEGCAFVYHGSSTGVNSSLKASMESDQANAYFGYSVSSAGDVNADGYSDVIVGARYYDNGETNEGAAFVYHGSSSGLSTTASTFLEPDQTGADFGFSAAGAGDVNGDGYDDVIVGAYRYDNGQTDEGVAFVFHGSSSGIATTAATTLEENQADAQFGYSVSTAGDVNGDGYSDVIVSARYYTHGQSYEGAAFVYHGSSSGINSTYAAFMEENKAAANMGRSVSCAGDVNGDGYSDVIVGADNHTNGQANEGAFYVYHGSSTGINTTAATSVESNQSSANLGRFTSCAGDVNGDGYSDVIVGAVNYDNGETDEGVVFVYHGSSSGISSTPTTTLEEDQAGASFGQCVSSAGDVNGDGYADVIVGAIYYDNGQTDEGAAFIYLGSSSGLSTNADVRLEADQADANFGQAVAGAGDVNGDGFSDVIVGSNLYENGQTDEGAAFVYHGGESDGLPNQMRFYDNLSATRLTAGYLSNDSFAVGLNQKSYLGRQIGRLVFEVATAGSAWTSGSNGQLSNSVAASDTGDFTDLTTTGTVLKKMTPMISGSHNVRARIEYQKTKAITGQVYGPWRYFTNSINGMAHSPLPVELTSFDAYALGETAMLQWTTASEINNSHFVIERMVESGKWVPIGRVEGMGNTQQKHNYEFIDNNPAIGKNFYRLRQVDFDGKFEFSPTRLVEFKVHSPKEVVVFPNPTTSVIYVASDEEISTITIRSMDGRALQVHDNVLRNTFEITLSDVPMGLYTMEIDLRDGEKTIVKRISVHPAN